MPLNVPPSRDWNSSVRHGPCTFVELEYPRRDRLEEKIQMMCVSINTLLINEKAGFAAVTNPLLETTTR